jgi:C-terminal peptidase prc
LKQKSLLFAILFVTSLFFCGPREAKKTAPAVVFSPKDFETVVSMVDSHYIDKNINKNRAYTDAAVYMMLSLPHPLYLFPESYMAERNKFEEADEIFPGKSFKISPSHKYVVFDPDYDKVEEIQKAKQKKNENRKLSDQELKDLLAKEKQKKQVLTAKWEEINFSKKDFETVLAYVQDNLDKYKESPFKNKKETEGKEEPSSGVYNYLGGDHEEDSDSEESISPSKGFTIDNALFNAANGYLASLDPHSNVFLKEIWEESMAKINDSSFEGIGAILSGGGLKDVVVENPLEGSPAVNAGVRSGDVIQSVDDKPIKGLPLDKVVRKIKGKKGTKVKLTLRRKGITGVIDIFVTRDKIEIKNISSRLIKDNEDIAYIKLSGFVKNSEESADNQIEKSLRALEKEAKEKGIELSALVLDLRNNAGGYLDLAIDIADMFIEKGLIVSTKVPNRSPEEAYARIKDITNLPLVILVNSKSASASEIVASAIQHHGRGLILGERTFGKATVQKLLDLKGNSDYVLKITNSRYYSPSGNTIQVVGVSPDIDVSEEPDGTFPFRYREEDMWNHLPKIDYDGKVKSKFDVGKIQDWVKKHGKAESYLQEHKADAIKPDFMLIRSVDYIRGFLDTNSK